MKLIAELAMVVVLLLVFQWLGWLAFPGGYAALLIVAALLVMAIGGLVFALVTAFLFAPRVSCVVFTHLYPRRTLWILRLVGALLASLTGLWAVATLLPNWVTITASPLQIIITGMAITAGHAAVDLMVDLILDFE